jgi:hypothetical protein
MAVPGRLELPTFGLGKPMLDSPASVAAAKTSVTVNSKLIKVSCVLEFF